LEKVNQQFRQFLDGLDIQATGPQLPYNDITTTTQPKPYLEPQPECATQYILLQEPLPAPNPNNSTQQFPTQRPVSLVDHSMRIGMTLVQCIIPSPPTQPCRSNLPYQSQTTIPNWAKPTVPPHATNPMTGMFSASNHHWPPPRPERKTIPFKEKLHTKPTVLIRKNEKDSLRPP